MAFKSITSAEHDAFVSALAAGQYNLLLGAGASKDSRHQGDFLPSGEELKLELCRVTGAATKHTLQRVFSLLTDRQVYEHITKRFTDCEPGPTALGLSGFLWHRIFTWNVDDVLENAYGKNPKQKLVPIHFSDDFVETHDLSELLLIYLHGTALQPEKGYVFSREHYVKQVQSINPWMSVLTTFMHSEPMVIAGTSLDEIDLDYYLSFRTLVSARQDRGPSILVTREDDAVTADLCDRHELLHFVGHASDFFSYCKEVLPTPPTPEELVPIEERKLLPPGVSKPVAMAFHSDFELVPSTAKPSDNSRFQWGHPPTWGDLAANLDVPRSLVSKLLVQVEALLKNDTEPAKLVLLTENAGTGKTTILRRLAFELSKRGTRTLLCSTLSRISRTTASTIDLIDDPVVIIVDNFADQATAVAEMLVRLERKDVVVVAAERSYRQNYLNTVLSDIDYYRVTDFDMTDAEAEALINKYFEHGNIGDHNVLAHKSTYARRLSGDPIAVACCRILKDFKPLERIVDDIVGDASELELDRYLSVALAQHCFMGGLRRSILTSSVDPKRLDEQIDHNNPLPLTYYDTARNYLIPENSIVAERVLERSVTQDRKRLLSTFVNLANGLAAFVNRETIKRRMPEARLAGRLFDYDDIAGKLLGDNVDTFYQQTKDRWQWNSRYWEQVALRDLARYHASPSAAGATEHLENSVQHARHAVAIELHPFGLTTLGKVLMAQLQVPGYSNQAVFGEAFENLVEAIERETLRARRSIQPFMSLFRGTQRYLDAGGKLTDGQRQTLRTLAGTAEARFSKEADLITLLKELKASI